MRDQRPFVQIDHINAYLTGGSAVAAQRLHHGLLQAGITSRFWHADDRTELVPLKQQNTYQRLTWGPPSWQSPGMLGQTVIRWSRERILRSFYRRGGAARVGMYTGPRRPFDTPFVPPAAAGVVLHLHWVSRILDYSSFFQSLPPSLPLVWTLHDMQPLTGGCHHAEGCNHFQHTCGTCPILGRPGTRDLSSRDHSIKRAALAGRMIHVVTPSRWLEHLARTSRVLPQGCSFQTIRNAISLDDFQPVDTMTARRQLGLPEDRLLIGYAAESLTNKPKGIEEFLSAISQLSPHHQATGLVFGRGDPPAGIANVPLINLGVLETPEQIRLAYSAADIFTVPSHAETISQTAPEALACGTPVVASNVGGIPEVVQHGETGLLAQPKDSASLAAQLTVLADAPDLRKQFAAAGCALVRREFDATGRIREYQVLYEHALATAMDPALTGSPVAASP
jgi:glycosyltransferase involved in cell wall biosynthesis